MTIAFHSSTLPDGAAGGDPAGFLLRSVVRSFISPATPALFSDMKLIGAGGLDLAVLPIGDRLHHGPG